MQILLRNGQKLMGLDNIVKIKVKMFLILYSISNIISTKNFFFEIILNIVLINLLELRYTRVFIFFSYLLFMQHVTQNIIG